MRIAERSGMYRDGSAILIDANMFSVRIFWSAVVVHPFDLLVPCLIVFQLSFTWMLYTVQLLQVNIITYYSNIIFNGWTFQLKIGFWIGFNVIFIKCWLVVLEVKVMFVLALTSVLMSLISKASTKLTIT